MTDNGRLTLTIREAANRLGISRNLAYSLAREGRLPGVIRLGDKRMVVSRAQLERLLLGDSEAKSDEVSLQ